MKLTEPLCGDVPAHSLSLRSDSPAALGQALPLPLSPGSISLPPPPLCRFSALLCLPLCPPHQILFYICASLHRLSVARLSPQSCGLSPQSCGLCRKGRGRSAGALSTPRGACRCVAHPLPRASSHGLGTGRSGVCLAASSLPAARPAPGAAVPPLTVQAGDKPFGRPWRTFCRNPSLEGCQSVFPPSVPVGLKSPKLTILNPPSHLGVPGWFRRLKVSALAQVRISKPWDRAPRQALSSAGVCFPLPLPLPVLCSLCLSVLSVSLK